MRTNRDIGVGPIHRLIHRPLHRLAAAVTLTLAAGLAPAAGAATESSATEAALLHAVTTLHAGDWRSAQHQLEALVQREPQFRLAQLMLADLLAARSGNPEALKVIDADNTRVDDLLAEYRARVQDTLLQAPPPGTLPDAVLQLSGNQRSAIVVDLPRSRLYVLDKRGGELHVVGSYYAAIARKGYGKNVAGDLRTPVGVYHATGFTPGASLPPFYGSGAFPLDYPNLWDRAQGRTGSGIWLHGVPADTYARPPRTSEGCVVLANNDLLALKPWIHARATPVVFSDGLHWEKPGALAGERDALLKRIAQWRAHWSARDAKGYLALYADDFETDGMSRSEFAAYKHRVIDGKQRISVKLSDIDLYRYPGEKNLVLAEFTQDYRSDALNMRSRKQQFWRKGSDGQWRIVREDNDSVPQTLAQK